LAEVRAFKKAQKAGAKSEARSGSNPAAS